MHLLIDFSKTSTLTTHKRNIIIKSGKIKERMIFSDLTLVGE